MKHLGISFFLILTLVYLPLMAQTIQVPDNCINKISPCLIHTNDTLFQFMHDGQQVKMMKDSILKISFNGKENNFEVISGRISLVEYKKNKKPFLVNNKTVRTGGILINRSGNNIKIMNLNDFVLSEYQISSNVSELSLVKADFVNKGDFVALTRHYFQSVGEFKKFLALQAPNWKSEFERQNSSQTKVLLRAIASASQNAKIEAEKNTSQQNEIKKAKETFFYRTFER